MKSLKTNFLHSELSPPRQAPREIKNLRSEAFLAAFNSKNPIED
jgi:hypothetical protein